MKKYFVIRNFRGTSHVHLSKSLRGICLSFEMLDLRGTCSSVGMLKGYMVRARLGTPVLRSRKFWKAAVGKFGKVGVGHFTSDYATLAEGHLGSWGPKLKPIGKSGPDYLPYLGICKSQNVSVNIYCNFTNELLCLLEILYRSNMDLFVFLTVIWFSFSVCFYS